MLGEKLVACKHRMIFPQRNNLLCKMQNFRIFFRKIPVQPCKFIVLAIYVIISVLSPPKFISGSHHGNTLRNHKTKHEIFYGLYTKLFDFRIICGSFKTVIVAVIIIRTVAPVFSVFIIVLCIVAYKVVKRKTVMRGYKIYGRGRKSSAVIV